MYLTLAAVAINCIIAVACLWQAITAQRQFASSLEKLVNEQAQISRDNWKSVIVYDIINEFPPVITQTTPNPGKSFVEIQGRYVDAATTANNIEIPKEQLSPIELKKTLLDLQSTAMIYETVDGRYIASRSLLNPRFDRTFAEIQAKHAILNIVLSDSGKFTALELSTQVVGKNGVTPEEFMILINSLAATREITIDASGKLWAAAAPPKP